MEFKLKAQGVQIVEFNPWMFSDSEQLVARFFSEMSANLGRVTPLEKVAKAIGGYGGAIVGITNVTALAAGFPQIGSVLGPVMEQLGRADKRGLDELREEVEVALAECDQRVVVVLDDVDRLSFKEIRDVFKLVRLTASFPNLVYVVLCDRERVADALAEVGQSSAYGRRYLEKIIQVPFDLPKIPRHLLNTQLDGALERAVPGCEEMLKDEEDWYRLYLGIVQPLIGNMRDVTRYASAVRWAWEDLGERVAFADLLAMEAIRLFVPAVFELLHETVDALTFPAHSRTTERDLTRLAQGAHGPADARSKGMVERLIAADEDHERVATAMVEYLFPYGHLVARTDEGDMWHGDFDQEQSKGRVADESVLRLYLERVEGPDLLNHADAVRVLRLLADGVQQADEFLGTMDTGRRVEVIRELCELASDFRTEHVRPGVVVLLNQLPSLHDDPTLIVPSPVRVLKAAVHRLLNTLDGPQDVADLVEEVLPNVSLSSRVDLLAVIDPSNDEALVTPEVNAQFSERLADEIRAAFADDNLTKERGAFAWLLSFPSRMGLEPIVLPDSVELDFRAFHTAQGTRVSSNDGVSRFLQTSLLKHVFGSEETALVRMERLCIAFKVEEWKERLMAWGVAEDAAEATVDLVGRTLRTYQRAQETQDGSGSTCSDVDQ